jgi:hypothetical protein
MHEYDEEYDNYGIYRISLKNIMEENMFSQSRRHQQKVAFATGTYIIGSVNNLGQVSFNPSPAVHVNMQTARVEAERLAQLDKNKHFVVVEVKGMVKASGVEWK